MAFPADAHDASNSAAGGKPVQIACPGLALPKGAHACQGVALPADALPEPGHSYGLAAIAEPSVDVAGSRILARCQDGPSRDSSAWDEGRQCR